MSRDGTPGYREYFRVRGVHLCRVGSWDAPWYGLFGVWYSPVGISVRYRGWILRLGR